jgi:predicted nucleic acid-binding protein
LSRINQINLDRDLLDAAAMLAPATIMRSLDAIHLAAAGSLGAELTSVVTYDRRMQDAAAAIGMTIEAPA